MAWNRILAIALLSLMTAGAAAETPTRDASLSSYDEALRSPQAPAEILPVAANDPDFAPDVIRDEDPIDYSPEPQRAPRGMLQRVYFSATRVAPGDEDDLGITEIKFNAMLGFPLPTAESPLLVTPGLSFFALDGFETLDLPDELYDAFAEFRTLRPLSETLILDLGVTPGAYGELDRGDESEFRLQGRAVGIYVWSETTKLATGILYLDRDDVEVLPAGGVIWYPTPDWQFDLVFPEPRVAMRAIHDPCCRDVWLYMGGELGGGQWGITRASGAPDVVTMRDIRVLAGFELKAPEIALRVEAGYVFGREIEYRSVGREMELGTTGLFRAAIIY